ncbi:sarcosine oxidase subunit alpha family protein [bacterium]|nr:sarcosine oxidase subunit alpha family protein [bacterium]
MTQPNRFETGGLIDRSETLSFTFNGTAYNAHPGDTLASALIANDVKLVARSFKYHRPRGIFTAGPEEPSALFTLGHGSTQEPNARGPVTEVFHGLEARSQNHIGSLENDLMAVNDWFAAFLGAGFYYKTFMWPRAFWERVYEPLIRRAAGLGALSGEHDSGSYDKGFLHCDVLVIGGGPTGLIAALTAGRAGLQVLLAEQDFVFGGSLSGRDDQSWIASTLAELESLPNVRLMSRSSVFGTYDHGIYGMLERKTDHLAHHSDKPRQVLWRVYSKQAIIATGATERPIAFANNDRPGIMLAGAVETYMRRFGVTPGQQIVAFGGDQAQLHSLAAAADAQGVEVRVLKAGEQVIDTAGGKALSSVRLNTGERIHCDALAVSGGWSPNVHLTSHHRSRPQWDPAIEAFVPADTLPAGQIPAGAAQGHFALDRCLSSGEDAAVAAAQALGTTAARATLPKGGGAQSDQISSPAKAIWTVPGGKGRAWIDMQNDVTAKDIKLAFQEGFRSVEHLKRYTTLGMATDQGKTSNVLGLAIMAEMTGHTIADTGTTMFRPPYQPVAMGALAGRSRGKHFKPTRITPSHRWAEEQGAVFVETGNWLRAQWYPQAGETHWRESVDREVMATRSAVGVCDVTTLGKIDIQGRDAATFLNRVYANAFAKLPVGKVRYGLMLREDGIVKDDGTTARLSETHFVMTTTTANAVSVFRHLEFCRQCLWPGLDVQLISATEQWAQFAVAGPNSRALLERVVDAPFDVSNEAFPFMACAELTVCDGTPARLFRISFSGEMAYELAVPTRYGDALIRHLMEVGEDLGVTPYGTEALGVMRIEKGHAAGNELNGQTTARDLSLGGLVSKKKDSVGRILSERPALNVDNGYRLVGFQPLNPADMLTAGAHFVDVGQDAIATNDQGYMTSVAYSPILGHSIGIGLLRRGDERKGERLRAVDLVRGKDIEVEVVSAHFVDPEGERLRA